MFGPGTCSFELYEDDGKSLNYERQQAHTQMIHGASAGVQSLVIGPTQGSFDGQPAARSYQLRIYGIAKPSSFTVNGRSAGGGHWDAQRGVAVLEVPAQPIGEPLKVEWH